MNSVSRWSTESTSIGGTKLNSMGMELESGTSAQAAYCYCHPDEYPDR